MKKRILSLLLALCLIVGLLPAVAVPHAHAEETAQKEMVRVMGYTDMEAWTDGRCTYAINTPVECYYNVTNEDGTTTKVTFQGTQWKVIATATKVEPEEWNLKFEWPAGGTPTLTLKGAILDYYDEDAGKYSTHFTADAYKYAIANKSEGSVLDLKIVIAEDSYIATPINVMGECTAYADVIIESVGDAKLTSRSLGGIRSNANLILNNANLDLEVPKYSAGYRPLYAPKGGITFNGGNYRLYSTTVGGSSNGQGAVGALIYAGAGDITFNGGTYDLHSGYYSTTGAVGAITNASAASTGYTIIFNDGNMTLNHRNISGFISNNVTQINGGSISATGTYYTLYKDTGYVKMTGGSLELQRTTSTAYYGAAYIDVSEHPCWTGVWGTSADDATEFTEITAAKRYINIVAHKQMVEVEGTAADCTNDGILTHYYCSKCDKNFADAGGKTELESIVAPSNGEHVPGEIVKENEVAAGCTESGTYEAVEYCTGCGMEMSRTTVAVDPLGHTAGETVKENEVAADCLNAGSYDAVVNCTVCGAEISRESVTVEALGHTEVEVAEKAPTVDAAGHTAGTKCETCGEVLFGCEEIPKLRTEMIRVDGYDDIKASEDGRCSYLVNQEVECTYTITNKDGTTETVTFTGYNWKVVGNWTSKEPAEWNVKYSFPKGGVPTLTLKGAILDYYDEENDKYATNFTSAYHNAILGKTFEDNDKYDLHIVIEEDSYIATSGTLVGASDYYLNTIISSVGDAKLTARVTTGIRANGTLTLNNANLEIEVPKYTGTGYNPIYVKGDIVFNGGNYKISSSATGTTSGTGATGRLIQSTAGSIIINDGNFDLDTSYYSSSDVSALDASNAVIINGGNIDLCHGLATGFKAPNGITMNGGSLKVFGSSNYTFGKTNGYLTMNGGNLEMYRNGGSAYYYSKTSIDLSGNPCWYGIAGTSPTSNKVFTELTSTNAYIKITAHELAEIPGTDATCTEPGLTAGVKCSVCGEILTAQEVIPETGKHAFDDADDDTCNNECGYTRPVAADLMLSADNKLVFADEESRNLYHRVVVYYLGEKTVSDITLTNNLLKIDPNAKTYWGIEDINNIQLLKGGNYVLHLFYNTAGSAKIKVAKQFTVDLAMPTVELIDNYKLNVTAGNDTIKNYRAIAYYLGENTDVDIYDEAALKAIDPTAKLQWGLTRINTIQMAKNGKYVVYLQYNIGIGPKETMVLEFNIKLPVPSVWLEENGQIGTIIPPEVVHRNYVIYYLGDQTVEDIRDVEALKAIDPDPILFDNQKQIAERGVLTEPGNYVFILYYNYAGSSRQYIAVFETLAPAE